MCTLNLISKVMVVSLFAILSSSIANAGLEESFRNAVDAARMNDVDKISKVMGSIYDSKNLTDLLLMKNKNDVDGDSILHILAKKNNSAGIKKLFDRIHGAENLKLLLLNKNNLGNTPSHILAQYGNISGIVEITSRLYSQTDLLQFLKAQNEEGNTVLHSAALTGHLNALQALTKRIYGSSDLAQIETIRNNSGLTYKEVKANLNGTSPAANSTHLVLSPVVSSKWSSWDSLEEKGGQTEGCKEKSGWEELSKAISPSQKVIKEVEEKEVEKEIAAVPILSRFKLLIERIKRAGEAHRLQVKAKEVDKIFAVTSEGNSLIQEVIGFANKANSSPSLDSSLSRIEAKVKAFEEKKF